MLQLGCSSNKGEKKADGTYEDGLVWLGYYSLDDSYNNGNNTKGYGFPVKTNFELYMDYAEVGSSSLGINEDHFEALLHILVDENRDGEKCRMIKEIAFLKLAESGVSLLKDVIDYGNLENSLEFNSEFVNMILMSCSDKFYTTAIASNWHDGICEHDLLICFVDGWGLKVVGEDLVLSRSALTTNEGQD